MQLMELQPGKKAVIRRLEGGRSVLSRLAALGFTPGAVITVLRSSDHGPLLVSLRGSRVALGRGEAAHIFVSSAGKEKTAEENPDLLEFLETNGIVPGAAAEVTEVLFFNQTLTLQVRDCKVALGFPTARYIYVEKFPG